MLYVKNKDFFDSWWGGRPDGWESHAYPAYISFTDPAGEAYFEKLSSQEVGERRVNELAKRMIDLDTAIEIAEDVIEKCRQRKKETLKELVNLLNGEG